jgi:hypothetical protein
MFKKQQARSLGSRLFQLHAYRQRSGYFAAAWSRPTSGQFTTFQKAFR